MSTTILITLCTLLLIAYLFDLTFARTRIPPVILLLLLGWGTARLGEWFGFQLPDMNESLKLIGTVGLIMIVMEGSLELELRKKRLPLVLKSLLGALLPLLVLAFSISYCFNYYFACGYRSALLNAIPLCVISSSIAIPSARNLVPWQKEYVTYESSLSDIFGVLFFNFVALNDRVTSSSLQDFSLEVFLMLLISLVATILLTLLLSHIRHHIKFFPIILLTILIYVLSKHWHLPSLLFILLFGLFLANAHRLKDLPPWLRFQPEELETEVHRFKELLGEATFLVRSLFFLLFGYLIQLDDLTNLVTLPWAAAIMAGILLVRLFQLVLSRLKVFPLIFLSPRGLITILLFLSIPLDLRLPIVNNALLIQVILLSAFLLMPGLVFAKTPSK